MVTHTAEIEKFESFGDKTGWSYVFVPQDLANQIKPDYRREFRVRGFLDGIAVSGMCLMPIKPEGFILPLKKALRKELRKEAGQTIQISLDFDADFKIEMPDALEVCLGQEEGLLDYFLSIPKSHQNYFINWLNTAKTEATQTKRLVMIVNAMYNKWDFGRMVREGRGTSM